MAIVECDLDVLRELQRDAEIYRENKTALLDFALTRWHECVANRPLVNVHRRTLDSVWREVIRFAGADDIALIGPRHDDLLDASGNPKKPQHPTSGAEADAARIASDYYTQLTEANQQNIVLQQQLAASQDDRPIPQCMVDCASHDQSVAYRYVVRFGFENGELVIHGDGLERGDCR